MGGAILFLILLTLYFVPTIMAWQRKQDNIIQIFIVNLLLGWSFIGWIVALVWAYKPNDKQRNQTEVR